ncbi:MAG: GAF domain-containing protein [Fimbriimonadaceae bacterium]|nr:GAF domain-containing protein [Fimbriimonadaceae bacterium]
MPAGGDGEQLAAQRLEALAQLAVSITASLDTTEVLPSILARACELLGARKGSLLLLDEAGEHLRIAVAHGLSAEVIASTCIALGDGIAGAVAASGEPRRLSPGVIERDGRQVAAPAAICVPLSTPHGVIGVLNLSDHRDGAEFSEVDLRLAELLAAQSAVALRNAQIFAEQQRQAAELRALQEVSIVVNDSLDLDETLTDVLRQATTLLQAAKGSIMLLDSAGEWLTVAVAYGLDPEVIAATRLRFGEGIAGEVAASGLPRRLAGGERAAGSVKLGGLPAAACVPLQAHGRVIGVLNVSDRCDGGDFSERDLHFLAALGYQAALALNNARLYDGLRERADALAALSDIGQALTRSLDRDEVLKRVLDSALRLLRCQQGSLMLLHSDAPAGDEFDPAQPFLGQTEVSSGFLSIELALGLPAEVVAETRIRLGEGVAGQVALTGQPLVLGQGRVEGSQSRQRSASLCLPLEAKGKVIGVLNLSEHQAGDFTDADLQLALTLSSQAATAIENARLYDDLRDQFVHSIRVIANAIDARDPYTRGHSDRVARYARLIAGEMALPEDEVETIYYAGLLHDVGKIGIRDNILLKEGKLTDDEFDAMKRHPVKSAEIIYPVKQLRRILPGLRHHHERFSSRGYPDGLHEQQIPLMARVIGVADTYDAMTSNRPYRKGLPRRVALEELARNRGLQFDPECVNAFLELARRDVIAEIDGQGPGGAADVAAALAAVEGAGAG